VDRTILIVLPGEEPFIYADGQFINYVMLFHAVPSMTLSPVTTKFNLVNVKVFCLTPLLASLNNDGLTLYFIIYFYTNEKFNYFIRRIYLASNKLLSYSPFDNGLGPSSR
jgi:hypothetical protein